MESYSFFASVTNVFLTADSVNAAEDTQPSLNLGSKIAPLRKSKMIKSKLLRRKSKLNGLMIPKMQKVSVNTQARRVSKEFKSVFANFLHVVTLLPTLVQSSKVFLMWQYAGITDPMLSESLCHSSVASMKGCRIVIISSQIFNSVVVSLPCLLHASRLS